MDDEIQAYEDILNRENLELFVFVMPKCTQKFIYFGKKLSRLELHPQEILRATFWLSN